jgi:death on curing protein
MKTKYVTLEEILRLHFLVIEDFGGSHGVREENILKSVIIAPNQVVFNKEQYSTIFDKAAVFLRNIIGDRPFQDGNKRTAATVCGIFLLRNGRRLTATPKELEDFAIRVATKHLEILEISRWIKCNTEEY